MLTQFTSYDLPDDIFEPGEVKPSKPKKKAVKKTSTGELDQQTAKKRKLEGVETEVRLQDARLTK
jgi:poly(A) polymerase